MTIARVALPVATAARSITGSRRARHRARHAGPGPPGAACARGRRHRRGATSDVAARAIAAGAGSVCTTFPRCRATCWTWPDSSPGTTRSRSAWCSRRCCRSPPAARPRAGDLVHATRRRHRLARPTRMRALATGPRRDSSCRRALRHADAMAARWQRALSPPKQGRARRRPRSIDQARGAAICGAARSRRSCSRA